MRLISLTLPRLFRCTLLLAAIGSLYAAFRPARGTAQESAPAAANAPTVSLLNGNHLSHFAIEGGAKITLKDGLLTLTEGNGWLRSHQQFSDFDLHVEWKTLQKSGYDAGIYIRAQKEGLPFPKQAHQINLLEGKEGFVGNLPGAMFQGLTKPAGEWNAFDIRVRGNELQLQVNGQPAYKVSGLKWPIGYIGLQCEVPKGGQFEFRNLTVREAGYESMFDGKSLAGWEGAESPAEACWKVDQSLLICTGAKGPWLRSAREYSDFNLRFDYQVSKGGNSGIYVRVPKDGNHHRENESLPPAGFEVQLLDDAAEQYKTLKDYQYSASVYDICGAQPRNCKPAGEWNTIELNCQGQQVTVTHNGEVVVSITDQSHPLLALRKTSGYLGLQNHSTEVKFRNLRIGPPLPGPAK